MPPVYDREIKESEFDLEYSEEANTKAMDEDTRNDSDSEVIKKDDQSEQKDEKLFIQEVQSHNKKGTKNKKRRSKEIQEVIVVSLDESSEEKESVNGRYLEGTKSKSKSKSKSKNDRHQQENMQRQHENEQQYENEQHENEKENEQETLQMETLYQSSDTNEEILLESPIQESEDTQYLKRKLKEENKKKSHKVQKPLPTYESSKTKSKKLKLDETSHKKVVLKSDTIQNRILFADVEEVVIPFEFGDEDTPIVRMNSQPTNKILQTSFSSPLQNSVAWSPFTPVFNYSTSQYPSRSGFVSPTNMASNRLVEPPFALTDYSSDTNRSFLSSVSHRNVDNSSYLNQNFNSHEINPYPLWGQVGTTFTQMGSAFTLVPPQPQLPSTNGFHFVTSQSFRPAH